MKAMMLADLALYCQQQRFYLLAFALSVGIVTFLSGLPEVILFSGFLLAYSALQHILLSEERHGWDRFRLALPLSRAHVVRGRYAFLAAVTATGIAFGVVVYGITCVITSYVPGAAQLALHASGFDGPRLALSVTGAFLFTFVMLGITLPFALNSGYTKAVQYTLAGFCLLLLAFPFASNTIRASQFALDPMLAQFAAFALSPFGSYIVAAGMLVAACVIYAASAALAMKRFAKREF